MSASENKNAGLKELIRPAVPAMLGAAALTALAAVLGIVPYAAMARLAELWLGEEGATPGELWLLAGVAVAALFAGQTCYSLGLGVTHIAEARLRHRLRERVVTTIGNMPLGEVSALSAGAIRKMVADDTAAIHTMIAHLPGDTTHSLVGAAAGFAYLLCVDWRLALALAGVWVVLIGAIGLVSMRGYGSIVSEFSEQQTALAAATVEMVEGIAEIKNFQAADATRTRFTAAREAFSALSYTWTKRSGAAVALVSAIIRPSSVFATVAPLAALFVWQGWTTPARALPFFFVALALPSGLLTLTQMTQHAYEARQGARATAQLLSSPLMPEGAYEGAAPQPGAVSFDGVSFGYSQDAPVLRDVSFSVEPGTVTAIVGPSGGGKTTIARLVGRFWDADSGTVRVGGIDVREATHAWLLSQLAIVFQDVALCHDTVGANIALGRPGATREQIEAAARAACVHDRIMALPEGYDTVIGEEGGFLSGGERQRVTLARAYLMDAPILVLDEATASADPRSERDIHRALSSLSEGRSVLVIAHRLSTIRDADQILVVDRGRIVERGTHDRLIALDGAYARLWRTQNPGQGGPGGPGGPGDPGDPDASNSPDGPDGLGGPGSGGRPGTSRKEK